jgi:NAD(P)-dependent dehydrogenase (short-subunit alcohol dehydrogenase family)
MSVAIVTGGSRGIGAATVRALARAGYAVAINYARDATRANALADDVTNGGGRAIAIAGDVAEEEAVLALFRDTRAALGPVTALVNNAGITGPTGPFASLAAADLQRVFAVNVIGTMVCAREAVRAMEPGGAIVNVSSIAARLGSAGEYVDYAASKAAIDTFTLGLAREVAPRGIRVNAVSPGLIDTEIHEAGRLDRLRGAVPLGRIGSADEVAAAICWLLSAEASYVTGSVLEVGGGR